MAKENAGWSPGAQSSYGAREVAKTTSAADIAIAGITSTGNIIQELVALAKTNPLIGVVLAIIVTDALSRGTKPVISPAGKVMIYTLIGFTMGVTIVADLAQTADNIISTLEGNGGQGSLNPGELIMPVATTLVENPQPPAPATRAGVPAGALLEKALA